MSRIDLVVFGASGFTGKYTVKELIKIAKAKGSNFTWGIAGRNKEKLQNVLTEMSKNEEYDASKVPIIVADINDADSLGEMAKQSKVILNCCGPYRFYGEAVVKACIENKTHHVDVSGEPQYMESMQLQYHEKAMENEVYVVSACGVDSIPADLGSVFFKKEFDGEVNSIEIFLDFWNNTKKSGSSVHYGTWHSAVYGVAAYGELYALRKSLFPKPLPHLTPRLRHRFPISKCELLDGKWCLPFPGSDRSVLKRSQYYLYENEKQRPIQFGTYVAFPSFIAALLVVLVTMVFGIMTRFSFGRQLLLKYPKLFSLGFASHEGPPEDEAENTYFSMTFSGEGWKEKLSEPTDQHAEAPNKKMVTKVVGKNPGYGATCIFLITSALTILEEKDKMPKKGGVYTPAVAFGKTNMIQRLIDLGIKFEVISRAGNAWEKMVEGLDDLLEALESDSNNTGSSTPDKTFRSELSLDISEILALDVDETPESKVESKEPAKREKIKCCPVYVGGTNFPTGCSNLISPRTCSALHCRNCDFLVSAFPNYEWVENVEYLFLRTNMPNFKKVFEKLNRRQGSIAYACHCVSFSTEAPQALHEIEFLPWFCRGHNQERD